VTDSQTEIVFKEVVGNPRPFGNVTQVDVIQVDVKYMKGAGYVLWGRVHQKTDDSMLIVSLFTGIVEHELLMPSRRFSAKTLAKLAAQVQADGSAAAMVERVKAELERRQDAGQSY
jgi:hypothetical protein